MSGPDIKITRIWARNFRSIQHVDVTLPMLTVLVGPNASGKSNVMDILRFFRDAFRSGLDSAISERHGISGIRRWSGKGRPYDVELGFSCDTPADVVDYGVVIASTTGGRYFVRREHARIVFKSRDRRPFEFEAQRGKVVRPGYLVADGPETRPVLDTADGGIEAPELLLDRIHWLVMRPKSEGGQPDADARAIWNVLVRMFQSVPQFGFYHIFPNTLREPQKLQNPHPLEEHGANLTSALRDLQRRSAPDFSELKNALRLLLPDVSDIQVTQVGGFFIVKLKHGVRPDPHKGAWFDLSQESDGTLRLLGILAVLHQSPSPSLIAIEEPELTIHPGATAVLADLLIEATRRSQIMVTTHSPDLLDRLPVESIRAVRSVEGLTMVGTISETQLRAVREGLFSPGELHRNEGLEPASAQIENTGSLR